MWKTQADEAEIRVLPGVRGTAKARIRAWLQGLQKTTHQGWAAGRTCTGPPHTDRLRGKRELPAAVVEVLGCACAQQWQEAARTRGCQVVDDG
jgi:hypothetical protein